MLVRLFSSIFSNDLDEESFLSSHRKPLFDKNEKETEQDAQLPIIKEYNDILTKIQQKFSGPTLVSRLICKISFN